MESENAKLIRELREAIDTFEGASASYGRENDRELGEALNAARSDVDAKIDAIAKALGAAAGMVPIMDAEGRVIGSAERDAIAQMVGAPSFFSIGGHRIGSGR